MAARDAAAAGRAGPAPRAGAAAAVDPQEQMLQDFAQRETLKKAGDMPALYGNKDKDQLNVEEWFIRFERSCTIYRWTTDAQKLNQMSLMLRGMAESFYRTMDSQTEADLTNYESVKAALKKHLKKGPQRTGIVKFEQLIQRDKEDVFTFKQRLYEELTDMMKMPDADLVNSRKAQPTWTVPIAEGDPDPWNELTLQQKKDIANRWRRIDKGEMIYLLFVNGLKEPIRSKVFEKHCRDLESAFEEACELEALEEAKRPAGRRAFVHQLAAQTEEELQEAFDHDEIDEDTIEEINAIRGRIGRGRFQPRRRFNNRGNNGQNRATSNSASARTRFMGKCHYCQIQGHRIADCNKKKREEKAKANSVQDEDVHQRVNNMHLN